MNWNEKSARFAFVLALTTSMLLTKLTKFTLTKSSDRHFKSRETTGRADGNVESG